MVEVMGWQLASQLQHSFTPQFCHLYDYALLLLYSAVINYSHDLPISWHALLRGLRGFEGFEGD